MLLLDTYRGSAVDSYLRTFADLAQGQIVGMKTRNVDPDRDWLAQAESAVSYTAYTQALLNPQAKPSRISNIFGETPAGEHVKTTLGPFLNCKRVFTSAYTPCGFTGWHTDYDEPGWYIMFSLCEGPGSEFYWIENEQIQTLKEPEGWTIKAGEIANKEPYFWHASVTPVSKWTIIMIWDDEQTWQQACDLITTKSSLDPVPELILYGIFE